MELETFGWDAGWADAFAPLAADDARPARVIAVHRETSIVRDGSGVTRSAAVSGRFRREAAAGSAFPAVGDWVVLEAAPAGSGPDDPAIVAAVLPRRSAFVRSASDANRRGAGHGTDEQVIAANIDIAFIVAGLDDDFNLRRLERYLAVSWASGVTPVVILNKADVADDLEARLASVEAIAPGVAVLVMSALTGDAVHLLDPYLEPGRTAAVLGSSGVGKSTLLNTLLGEARQATAAVRADDSRGRHTTTHRELFVLPGGALLIDTPGIRSLQVVGADVGLETTFEDVDAIALTCRFSDCGHDGEPGCAIAVALADGRLTEERLASHRKLESELARVAREADPRAKAEHRRTWTIIHRSSDEHRDRKYGRDR